MVTTRVALVGYGYWGPNLARNFHQLSTSELAMCCDLDEEKLINAQALYPRIRVTSDYREVLEDTAVEAVAIATPARSHFTLAKDALQRGKHLLVEKPMAMSSDEARELIDLALRQEKVLMAGHTFEYNPAVLKIKQLIDKGALGDLHYIYSARVNLGRVQRDLNALWSIAPHDISILIYLLGCMPLEVSARGGTYLNNDVEDVVFLDLCFPDGVIAHVHASWLDPSKVRRVTIVGSQKMIVYDDIASEGKVKIYDKGVFQKGDKIYGEFQYKLHSGDIYIPKIDMTEPLRNECAHFIECIQQGKRPRTDGENGLRVIRVLEAADESLRKRGMPVQVGL